MLDDLFKRPQQQSVERMLNRMLKPFKRASTCYSSVGHTVSVQCLLPSREDTSQCPRSVHGCQYSRDCQRCGLVSHTSKSCPCVPREIRSPFAGFSLLLKRLSSSRVTSTMMYKQSVSGISLELFIIFHKSSKSQELCQLWRTESGYTCVSLVST